MALFLGRRSGVAGAAPVTTGSLSFNGAAVGEYNLRCINIPRNGRSIDLGGTDFCFKTWLRATSGNTRGEIARGADVNWQNGNIPWDSDESGQGNGWGFALGEGRIAFGGNNGGNAFTIGGGTSTLDLRGAGWVQVCGERRLSDGFIWLYLGGTLIDSQDAAGGSWALSGLTPLSICGPNPPGNANCAPTDNALVGGIEKGGFDNATFPGFFGEIGPTYAWRQLQHAGSNYTVETSALPVTANMVLRMLMGEGSGTTVNDTSGEANHGTLNVSGGRPQWNAATPYA